MADQYLSTDPLVGQRVTDALQSDAYKAATATTDRPSVDGAQKSSAAPSDPRSVAVSMFDAAKLVPAAQRVLEEAATNPAIKSGMSEVGQVVGGLEGLMRGDPLAVAGGVWAGGNAGWHTGKLIQRMAAPVATVAEKVAPYAQVASTLSGAQAVLDLAQMADPNRTDIGVLGIGKTQPKIDPSDPAVQAKVNANRAAALQWAKDHPAPSVQALTQAFADMVASLKAHVEGTK